MSRKAPRRPPLNEADRAKIRSLARSNVEKTFEGLQRFIGMSRWVGKSNRYSRDTINRIYSEVEAGPIRSPRQLSQYIAASSFLHCADGWSYLGKAILSLLRGDPHRALHFAYYAELRGALSLLASEGIGIFNNRHFAIDRPNSVTKLQTHKGTHQAVWNCLEYWGKQRRSSELLARVIKPYGRDLFAWLDAFGGRRLIAPQAQRWLRQWGMDLRIFADDRSARNVSSYRPDGIPDAWRLDAAATLQFAREIWETLEPTPGSAFDRIDSHIFRIALESSFKATNGKAPADDPEPFKDWITEIVAQQGFSQSLHDHWVNFLIRKIDGTDLSILRYSGESPDTQANSHFGILSRAVLLLRIAAGSAAEIVQSARLSSETISFWWQNAGPERGLWEGNREGSLIDLWADVEPWLQQIDSFQRKYAIADQTFFKAGNDLGQALVGLGSCERVAIWSMTP